MYSNDVRVANTAAPSFQAKANVTQYGWTDVDQGHYNQLIQYVDECRKIRDELDDKIDYINEILKGISGIDEQVKYVTQKADEVAEDARQVRTSVIYIEVTFNRLNTMIAGFDRDYADFSTKYADFEIKYVDVLLAATDAAESATQAEAWYSKTYDLYLDLKEGQVYRGTWNPATAAYPAHSGTNSVWDVILDVGLDTVPFGGFEWHNGDRLLYILADNKYDQLRTGSGVLSINNMTGAVTIDHTHVGALAVDGVSVATKKFETPVKIAGKEFDGSGDLDIYPNDIQAVPEGRRINNHMLTGDINLTSADTGSIALTDSEATGDKVMRVGGPRDLQIQAALSDATGGAYMNEHPPVNPIPGARWFDTNEGRTYLYYVDADSAQWIEENPQSPDIIQTSTLLQELANDHRLDTTVQMKGDHEIFHEGNLPTIGEVQGLEDALENAGGNPVLSIAWVQKREAMWNGYVAADGQLLKRADYPSAWAAIAAGKVPVTTEETWASDARWRGSFTEGDGSTTFRVPDYNGKSGGSLGAAFLRGDGLNSNEFQGSIQPDGIKSHDASVRYQDNRYVSLNSSSVDNGGLRLQWDNKPLDPNKGEIVSKYFGEKETRPVNVTGCWSVKLFGAVQNAGAIDAAGLATQIAELQSWPQSGSNSNGNWIKYRDGTMTCTRVFQGTVTQLGTTAQGIVYCHPIEPLPYPVAFVGLPAVNINFLPLSTCTLWASYSSFQTTTHWPSAYPFSELQINNITVMITMTATGRWK